MIATNKIFWLDHDAILSTSAHYTWTRFRFLLGL